MNNHAVFAGFRRSGLTLIGALLLGAGCAQHPPRDPAVASLAPGPTTPIKVCPPEYPEAAMQNRIQGHVQFSFSLNTAGEPFDLRVIDASPPDLFNKNATRAMSCFRYPKGDVRHGVTMTVTFRLEGAITDAWEDGV